MRNITLALGVVVVGGMTVLGSGCGNVFSPCVGCLPPPIVDYLPLTSPENLVHNLQVSYRRQEIARYVEILAPEFRFEYQSVDTQEIGLDSWNRNQDSTGVDCLFRSPLVSDIRLELTHAGSEEPTEIGFDPGTRKIRINPTFLEVDQVDGITWQVDGDVQDMFFRKGREAAGEDTNRWFLFEWRDTPNPGSASDPRGREARSAPEPDTVRKTTWGRLLTMFCD